MLEMPPVPAREPDMENLDARNSLGTANASRAAFKRTLEATHHFFNTLANNTTAAIAPPT